MSVAHWATTTWSLYAPVLFSLLCAMGLGGVIGIERQWRQRLAGVRTNALVAMGAASFTLFAVYLPHPGNDSIARVAAQVVPGIGFLGAGVIMRDGFTVQGLTTAATLWCSAAVGVLSGAGQYDIAILSAMFILGVNLFLRPLSRAIDAKTRRSDHKEVSIITIDAAAGSDKDIRKVLHQFVATSKMQWLFWSVSPLPNEEGCRIMMKVSGLEAADPHGHQIMQVLHGIDHITSVDLHTDRQPPQSSS